MLLPDVNVFVYAHRHESPRHEAHRAWLESLLIGDEPFGVSEHVLAGFLRVVTNRRVFSDPTPILKALDFADEIVTAPAAVRLRPGARHWTLFTTLCREGDAKGNLVPDAFLAALAIEHGATWVTHDRGFARFPGLRWTTPLA